MAQLNERKKRRKKIRSELEKRLKKAEKERKYRKEAEKHGFEKVREIETIEGTETITPMEKYWKGEFSPVDFKPKNKPFEPKEFYIKLDPVEIALIEKSKRMKKGRLVNRLRELIEKESGIALIEEQLRTLKEELRELMEAYGINENETDKAINEMKASELKRELTGLMELIELDRKLQKELLHKPSEEEQGTAYFKNQKERIRDLAIQVKIHKIIFDASIVYAFIERMEKTDLKEIARALEMKKESVKTCIEILKAQEFIKEQKLKSGKKILRIK